MPRYAASGISAKPSLVHFPSPWQRREDHLPCTRSYSNPSTASQSWRLKARRALSFEIWTTSPATSSISKACQSPRHWSMVSTWQTDAAPALRSSHLLGGYGECLNTQSSIFFLGIYLSIRKTASTLVGHWHGETATNFLHPHHLHDTRSLRHARADHCSRCLLWITSSYIFTRSKSWPSQSG